MRRLEESGSCIVGRGERCGDLGVEERIKRRGRRRELEWRGVWRSRG